LIWSTTRVIAAPAQRKPGNQRLQRTFNRSDVGGSRRALAHLTQLEPLTRHGPHHAQPPLDQVSGWARQRDRRQPLGSAFASQRLDHDAKIAQLPAVAGHPRQGPGKCQVASGVCHYARFVASIAHEDDHGVGHRNLEQRRTGLARQQLGQCSCIDNPPHDGVVGIGRCADELARAGLFE
jgi:hypothetical protein